MDINKHNRNIKYILKEIETILNEDSASKIMGDVKTTAQKVKSNLSRFVDVKGELPQSDNQTINQKIWEKSGTGSKVVIKFHTPISNLPSPNGSSTISIPAGEYTFKPLSYGKKSMIHFEVVNPSNFGGIKNFLIDFDITAEVNQPNEGHINTYDTSTKQSGARGSWSGRITKIEK